MLLAGRTALVTGGARGIGRAVVERLAREGARVIVTARSLSAARDAAGAVGGIGLAVDLADGAGVEAFVSGALAAAGTIDILVNNAGVATSASLEKTSDAMWEAAFALNVTAPFRLCRALIPGMKKRGFGRVVNIASNAGLTGYAYTAAYCASKHAVVGLTRALAVETAKSGVTVNAVCPGFVDTDMTKEAVTRIAKTTSRSAEVARAALAAMSPQNRLIEPAEVAHLVALLCAPAAAGIHGQAIPLDGGQVMK